MTQSKIINNFQVNNKVYTYPLLLLGIYITLLLTTVVLANRLIQIFWLLEPGGIFFFPLAFPILDIMGEVYGYSYPRLFIWVGAICELAFAFSVASVAHFPHPEFFQHAEAYQIVLDPTVRFVLSSVVGTIVGEFLTIFFLAKWKVKLRGKHFILRCIGSTALGQIALTIIVDTLAFSGTMPVKSIIWMMICGYLCKMLYSVLLAFPSWLVVKALKNREKADYFDINTNFNPFRLTIENNQNNCGASTNEDNLA